MAMDKIFVDVDVQRDFCEANGALYVPGSPNDVFRTLVQYARDQRIPILGSVDSHAWDAWEFASSDTRGPNGEKPNFPDHCVKGTAGWLKVDGTLPQRFRFVPNVTSAPIDDIVGEVSRGQTCGVYFEKEVYSMFANHLAESFIAKLLKIAETNPHFYVFGVATDYCVKAAALGLAQRGYRTVLLTDAIAGITPDGVKQAMDEMRDAGVEFATTQRLFS